MKKKLTACLCCLSLLPQVCQALCCLQDSCVYAVVNTKYAYTYYDPGDTTSFYDFYCDLMAAGPATGVQTGMDTYCSRPTDDFALDNCAAVAEASGTLRSYGLTADYLNYLHSMQYEQGPNCPTYTPPAGRRLQSDREGRKSPGRPSGPLFRKPTIKQMKAYAKALHKRTREKIKKVGICQYKRDRAAEITKQLVPPTCKL